MKEEEPQVASLHQKQMVVERATPEGAELASIEPPPPSVKEKELSNTSSAEQDNQDRKGVVEEATESHLVGESKAKEANQPSMAEESSGLMTDDKEEVKEEIILPSKAETPVNESKEKLGLDEGINEGQDGGCDIKLHETPVADIHQVDQRQETVQSNPEPGTELKSSSDILVEQESGSKTYFETSSKSNKEESPQTQSYYELSTAAETRLSGDTEIIQKLEEQQDIKVTTSPAKMSLEQRSLSLNITVGSTAGQTVKGEKSRTSSESLCPISGSFDESETYPSTPSVESHAPRFPPAVSITATSTESPEDTPTQADTPLPSDKHSCSFESSSLSEMLDLAGALPRLSIERREVDHMRRKSVPANVSTLVGSSLAKLALGDQSSRVVGGEGQLEELGYCVFNEYSGPMPSPADVPSPGDSPYQRFPAMEGEVEQELGAKEIEGVQKGMQHQDDKGNVPEISQKTVFEKKDAPVKTTLILERAVTSGLKPDRLRIPITTSKDRLTEFRLESGLPGDIKIQAIPEVDIEKDPSREASPIPPDNSFTFTPTETGVKVPPTPTTPKSPDDTPSETQVIEENASETLPEVKAQNDPKTERTDNKQTELDKEMQKSEQEESEERSEEPEMVNKDIRSAPSQSSGESTEKDEKTIQRKHGTPTRLEGIETQKTSKVVQDLSTEKPLNEKDSQMQLQEVKLEKDSPKPLISSPVIIIPQAQIEEEADEEDDIEIAEEPQEIMEEAEVSVLCKTDQANQEVGKEQQKKEGVRLLEVVPMVDEDPKSGAEEWSHSAQSDDGEPATDSSHLSPCSDRDLPQPPEERDRDEDMREDKAVDNTHTEEGKNEEGEEVKKVQTEEEEVAETGSGELTEQKEEKAVEGEDEGEERTGEEDDKKDIEIGQEVEETSDGLCQTSQPVNDETTMDISVLDTDSGWMDSQGTQSYQTITHYQLLVK